MSTNNELVHCPNQTSTTTHVPVACLTLNSSLEATVQLPTFSDLSLIRVIILVGLFLLAIIGNVLILCRIVRMRRWHSTITTLLMHLCTADLIVSLFCIFGDAVWAATVQWLAGEAVCKMVKYFQVFSLYLSTYLVVLISVDRCLAITCPMLSHRRRDIIKVLIVAVWIFSAFASVPQSFIFRVSRGPFPEEFFQCITDTKYRESGQEDVYLIASTALLFFVPLIMITSCYVKIIWAISGRKAEELQSFEVVEDPDPPGYRNSSPNQRVNTFFSGSSSSVQLHRPMLQSQFFRRAKRKSFLLSLAVVTAFIVCWSPYYLSMFGSKYFRWDHMGPTIQASVFFFGMSNSLINPLIYSFFHLSGTRSCFRLRSVRHAVVFQNIEIQEIHSENQDVR